MEEFELHEEILELLVDQLELVLKSGSRLVLPILPVNVQVWSLTKFYSVDFLLSRIAVKSVFFTNTIHHGFCELFLTVSWDLHA